MERAGGTAQIRHLASGTEVHLSVPVDTLDDMAKSAVSEMSNMITANSTINFSNDGVNVDISVPTMLCGTGISIEMSKEQVITVIFDVDGMEFTVHVSIE